jgi:hypothetical protein
VYKLGVEALNVLYIFFITACGQGKNKNIPPRLGDQALIPRMTPSGARRPQPPDKPETRQ